MAHCLKTMRFLGLMILAGCAGESVGADAHPAVPTIFDCVLDQPNSEVHLNFGVNGCFGGDNHWVALTHENGEFVLDGMGGLRHLSRSDAEHLVHGITMLMRIPETTLSECMSTNDHFARVGAKCGRRYGEQTFHSSSCDGSYRHAEAITQFVEWYLKK